MKASLFVLATFSFCLASLRAADSTAYEGFTLWKAQSPSGRYFAAARRTPTSDFIWKEDLDGFRLVVFRLVSAASGALGDKPFSYDFPGRLPARIEWTADSKFLVFTTVSSGGHQPYRFTAYAYSAERNALRCVDEKVGIVVSPDFKIHAASSVDFQTCKQTDGIDFEHPFPVTVELNTLFKSEKIGRPN